MGNYNLDGKHMKKEALVDWKEKLRQIKSTMTDKKQGVVEMEDLRAGMLVKTNVLSPLGEGIRVRVMTWESEYHQPSEKTFICHVRNEKTGHLFDCINTCLDHI